MPRDNSGNYTLPNTPPVTNPVVTDTTITSDWANGTLDDIATELQDSLSRSGKGAMTAPMQFANGTVSAPSITFTADATSGWFRNAASDIRGAVAGVWRWAMNATGVLINGTLGVTGNTTITGNLTVSGTISGVGGAGGYGSMAAGLQTINSTTYVAIPGGGLSATLTCVNGGRVVICVQNAGVNAGIGYIRAVADAGANRTMNLRLFMDGTTTLDERGFALNASEIANLVGFTYIGTIGNGAHTIAVQGLVSNAASSLLFQNLNITVYEM